MAGEEEAPRIARDRQEVRVNRLAPTISRAGGAQIRWKRHSNPSLFAISHHQDLYGPDVVEVCMRGEGREDWWCTYSTYDSEPLEVFAYAIKPMVARNHPTWGYDTLRRAIQNHGHSGVGDAILIAIPMEFIIQAGEQTTTIRLLLGEMGSWWCRKDGWGSRLRYAWPTIEYWWGQLAYWRLRPL